MADFLRGLRSSPVIPAVRGGGEALEKALSGDHPGIFVLGGDVFELVRRIGVERRRPPVFVNVDLIGGVAGDAIGIGFLARHVEGVISTRNQVIELANAAGMITIQHLFAIDASAIERGLKRIERAKPRCVEVLPAMSYPSTVSRYPEVLARPVLAGGLLKTREEVSFILEAGAAGVSTSHQELWTGDYLTRDSGTGTVPQNRIRSAARRL